MENKRVLHVINSLNVGGAEKILVDIILNSRNIESEIYVLNNEKTMLTSRLCKEGVKINNGKTKKYVSIKHIIWLLKNAKNYDIIHAHLSYSQYYVAILKIFNKKLKLVTTEHSTFNRRRDSKIFKWIEDKVYGIYDKIVVISNENLEAMKEWQPKTKNKIIVIENGIELKKYQNGKKENIKDEILLNVVDKKKILMIAAFREAKNHRFAIKMMNMISDEYVLILVGDGQLRGEIENDIKRMELDSKVILLGNRNNVEDLIKFSDIAIMPSKWEGFGLAAVECMAGGVSIIASRVEGLKEVVGNEELLFESNNEKELIEKIYSIINSKEKNEKMKKYCIERSMKYDIEITIGKYKKIYEEEE